MSVAENLSIESRQATMQRNRAAIRYWLYVICLLVFAMVIVGGATRLTDSGLSITQWEPIHGVIPPLTEAEWQEELEKYRQIPEYQQINKGMSLDAFKVIYWWEWAHRLLGRVIGLAFAVPLAFFWWRGMLEDRLKPRLLGLLALGGAQGVIGWWMVMSGLVDRVDVSQYRLAIHLTLACVIFAWAMWIARALVPQLVEPGPVNMRRWAGTAVALVLMQVFLGGLVAGLDAGLSFNDWPLMDGAILPGGLLLQEPAWINFFENPKTVQFVHRMFAYGLLVFFLAALILALRLPVAVAHKARALMLLGLVVVQALIGIVTLVMHVPLDWALFHQGGAVVVLGVAVAHWRALVGPYPQPSPQGEVTHPPA